jgi:hypothetical protein
MVGEVLQETRGGQVNQRLLQLDGRQGGALARNGRSDVNRLSESGRGKEYADPAGKGSMRNSVNGGADEEGLLRLCEGDDVGILVEDWVEFLCAVDREQVSEKAGSVRRRHGCSRERGDSAVAPNVCGQDI